MSLDAYPQRGDHYETTVPERLEALRKSSDFASSSSIKTLGLCVALALAFLLLWRMIRMHQLNERLRRQREDSAKERKAIRERLAAQKPGLLALSDPDMREDFREVAAWQVRLIKPGTQVFLLGGATGEGCLMTEATEMKGRRLEVALTEEDRLEDDAVDAVEDESGFERFTLLAYEDEDESWMLLPVHCEATPKGDALLLAPAEGAKGVRLDAHSLFQCALLAHAAALDDEGNEHDERPITVTGLGLRQATLIDERDWEPDRPQALALGLPGEHEAVHLRARSLPKLSEGNEEVRVLLLDRQRESVARLLRWLAQEHGHLAPAKDEPEPAEVG